MARWYPGIPNSVHRLEVRADLHRGVSGYPGTGAVVSLTEIGVQFSSFQAAMIGLGLNAAAYLSEIYRSGLEAVPKGQEEARRHLLCVVLSAVTRRAFAGAQNEALSQWLVRFSSGRAALDVDGPCAIFNLTQTADVP
jgi:predicted membrane-bound mannosyltransferase